MDYNHRYVRHMQMSLNIHEKDPHNIRTCTHTNTHTHTHMPLRYHEHIAQPTVIALHELLTLLITHEIMCA